ncbi:hypothetical protein [Pediococcus pentosaceus]|uniref:hypothetical protein n=1 Tax=Pediococcus pentosaceus TaxID=1255 RepID=UPI002380B954|nr:hypothetical protein [Pediococcus pentosaceus]MDE3751848.1 hypothetical protein [Pediococcus pentosaceus]
MSLDIINMIIGLLALAVAILAFIYTWLSNRYSIEILSTEFEKTREHNFVYFEVANTSTRTILIKDIKLFTNSTELSDNGFDPEEYEEHLKENSTQNFNPFNVNSMPSSMNNIYLIGNSEFSHNFTSSVQVAPGTSKSFSYYLDEIPNKISVTTNKQVGKMSKEKSFIVHFQNQN